MLRRTLAVTLLTLVPAGAAHARPVRPAALHKQTLAGDVRPIGTGTTVVAITAFPTGGKGSGTEATCDLWSDQLQADEGAVDAASGVQDKIDAVNALNTDVDNALDAGCVVIYSRSVPQPGGARPVVSTVSLARGLRGGLLRATWTPTSSVMAITAFPAGGKGSGTEATCALWTQRLQDDQQVIDDAPETDKQDAAGPLEHDVDNALDAGCAVIY